MDEDRDLGFPASDVLFNLAVCNHENVLLETRWGIVDVLWSHKASWEEDDAHIRRHLHAVEQAMESAEGAWRLVIEILGDDCQVEWFWNTCQGHYAAITAFERRSADVGVILPDYDRPKIEKSAKGGTCALAILTALVRVKGYLNVKAEKKKAEQRVKTSAENDKE